MKNLVFALAITFVPALVNASPPLKGKVTELWINDSSNTNIAFVSVQIKRALF
ncbi:hypothetical protein [Aliikangiella maris]|uniref:Uncharacterized protein n=2 Tax=Aliikangiella maris TaxID=3162458 RepID=A0ABV3MU20_9GAMM